MNHLNDYATINSAVDTLCSAMAEKGYPNYIPTADTLWNVYSLVSTVNNGSVPYDLNPNSADFCKGNTFNYGVKAEKAKARKHHKASIQKKNPCKRVKTRSAGLWYDFSYDLKRYDKYCKSISAEKGKRKFRSSQATLFDYDEEVNFIKAETKAAEIDYAEYLRVENMSEEEKEAKRNILKDALARYMISRGEMYEFSTERGTFMFDEDSWGESFYLFKKEEKGEEFFLSIYAIWDYSDGTYFDGDYDKVIEDMVKII